MANFSHLSHNSINNGRQKKSIYGYYKLIKEMGKSKYSLLPRKDELKALQAFSYKIQVFFSPLFIFILFCIFLAPMKIFFFLLQVVIKLVMKIEFQKVVFIEQREVYERKKKLNRNQILSSKSETQKTPS